MAEAKTITCQLYSKADRDDCWLFKKIERKLAKENFPDYEFKEVRNAKLDDFLGKLGKAENEIDNSLKTGLLGLGNLGR